MSAILEKTQSKLQNDEKQALLDLIGDNWSHCRWLNTLSLLENTGARKISSSQRFLDANEKILQHCFEEHRHAWYLKKQIKKLDVAACPTYEPQYLLAPVASKHYLHRLDVAISRIIKQRTQPDRKALVEASYLWVTYAIEVRASSLYDTYQSCLELMHSPISVRSIIAEEENHLAQMKADLAAWSDDWRTWADEIEQLEDALYQQWFAKVASEL